MPMPAPAVMSAAAGTGMSSGFSSALGYGLGTTTASLLGNKLGGSQGVNFRGKYQRNVAKHKLEYDPQFIAANTKAGILAKVAAAKQAGLHPLAALGISPASGTGSASPTPIIPGQSELGGAVEKGINTYLNVRRANQAQAARIEEQQLRNDRLRQQMRHSEIKLAAQLANYKRPGDPEGSLTREPEPRRPHHSEGMPVTFTSSDGNTYSVPGGTSAEELERWINDWAQWMPDILGRAWATFKAQARNNTGIKGDYWERSGRAYQKANPPKGSKPPPTYSKHNRKYYRSR